MRPYQLTALSWTDARDRAARGDLLAIPLGAMPALRPLVVRRHRAAAGKTQPLRELLPRLRSDGVGAVSASGILGDPVGADSARLDGEFIALTREVQAWRGQLVA
ncbi:hypothetical protein ACWDYH_06110 [Nocardia goodfellowii]